MQLTRVKKDFTKVFMAAIVTVCRYLFVTSGEIITQGLDLLILLPWTASKSTSQTSNL